MFHISFHNSHIYFFPSMSFSRLCLFHKVFILEILLSLSLSSPSSLFLVNDQSNPCQISLQELSCPSNTIPGQQLSSVCLLSGPTAHHLLPCTTYRAKEPSVTPRLLLTKSEFLCLAWKVLGNLAPPYPSHIFHSCSTYTP